eukprot:scaffold164328_cov32-Tisochrysis_lutea.AAC.5
MPRKEEAHGCTDDLASLPLAPSALRKQSKCGSSIRPPLLHRLPSSLQVLRPQWPAIGPLPPKLPAKSQAIPLEYCKIPI